MWRGITYLLITGCCWVGIAAVINMAARRHLNIGRVQLGSGIAGTFVAGIVMTFQSSFPVLSWQNGTMAALLCAAGMGNFFMIKLMKVGMERGNSGAVWGITQSALICPFLMGMFFFGVSLTWPRFVGIWLILTAIMFFGRSKSTDCEKKGNWLVPTFGAFALSGLAQCFANLPSYWGLDSFGSIQRTFWGQAGLVVGFAIVWPFEKGKKSWQGTLPLIVILTVVNIGALFFFFYRGLNLVADAGCGSIGYPIAQGSCIALFLLYSCFVLKERFNKISALALCCMILGIFIIAL